MRRYLVVVLVRVNNFFFIFRKIVDTEFLYFILLYKRPVYIIQYNGFEFTLILQEMHKLCLYGEIQKI